MINKILMSFLIILIFTFQTSMSYRTAQAASWADVPGYVDEAFAGIMVGAMTVSAAGMHATQWMTDNTQKLYEGAKEAYQTLSPEVKANFLESLSNAGDRIVIAGDWITSTLDSMRGSFSSGGVDNSLLVNMDGSRFYPPTGYTISISGFSKLYWEINAKVYSNSYKFEVVSGNAVYYESGYFNGDYGTSSQRQLYETLTENLRLSDLISLLSSIGAPFSISYNGNVVDTSMKVDETFNSIDKRMRETDIPSGQLDNIYYPKPEAYTPDNVKLRVNDSTGALTLPDGTIYTGEYTWRIPNTAVLEVDGVAIPTTTTGEGDVINIITGEVVIPAEVEVPPGEIPSDFANPTKSIDWAPLVMNAQALTTKFPFSLPWDLLRQLGIFDVEPETPVFKINIKEYLKLGETDDEGNFLGISVPMKFDVDLSMFDPVAAIVRWFTRIIWVIGLIFVLRKLLPE